MKLGREGTLENPIELGAEGARLQGRISQAKGQSGSSFEYDEHCLAPELLFQSATLIFLEERKPWKLQS